MNFEFQTPRSTLVGSGTSGRLGELARQLRCQTIFLVTDKGVEQAGLLKPALASLAAAGIAVTVYSNVQADPPAAIVMAAVDAAVSAQADGVIGLGGGSSLDVAKLVALLAPGHETLEQVYGVGAAKGPRLPLILVPTTAGTGSEVTAISIVTTGEGQKKGVVTPVIIPDWAVLDADLTLGLPPHVTAATGVDAMVHAIEAFTSKRLKNPLSDVLAREALALLGANIHEVCRNGSNRVARENMLLGAMLAGMAFANSPVAAVHALAYPIGARFHVPHGLSNSLVLPAVLRFNAEAAPELYAQLADILVPGVGGTTSEKTTALVRYLAALPAELGLPTRLADVGIVEADLPSLAEDAMLQTRLLVNNPRELLLADAHAIYAEVL
ncbi:MAG: iron-containing alcohol dehydrogenase [Burkholderiales bacterium]